MITIGNCHIHKSNWEPICCMHMSWHQMYNRTMILIMIRFQTSNWSGTPPYQYLNVKKCQVPNPQPPINGFDILWNYSMIHIEESSSHHTSKSLCLHYNPKTMMEWKNCVWLLTTTWNGFQNGEYYSLMQVLDLSFGKWGMAPKSIK